MYNALNKRRIVQKQKNILDFRILVIFLWNVGVKLVPVFYLK